MHLKRTSKNNKNQMKTNMEGVPWKHGLNAYQCSLCDKRQQNRWKNNVDDIDRGP